MGMFRDETEILPQEISDASLLAKCISLMLNNEQHDIKSDQMIEVANHYLAILSSLYLHHDTSNDTAYVLFHKNKFIKFFPQGSPKKNFLVAKDEYSLGKNCYDFFYDFLSLAFSDSETKRFYQSDISSLPKPIIRKSITVNILRIPASIFLINAIEIFACYMIFGHGDRSQLDFDVMDAKEFARRVFGIDLSKIK